MENQIIQKGSNLESLPLQQTVEGRRKEKLGSHRAASHHPSVHPLGGSGVIALTNGLYMSGCGKSLPSRRSSSSSVLASCTGTAFFLEKEKKGHPHSETCFIHLERNGEPLSESLLIMWQGSCCGACCRGRAAKHAPLVSGKIYSTIK